MAFWDGLITFAIVVTAVYYLCLKFRKVEKSDGCAGCGSDSCCGEHKSQSGDHKPSA